MLGRLAAKDDNKKRPFKPQIYQSRGRGKKEVIANEIIRTETD